MPPDSADATVSADLANTTSCAWRSATPPRTPAAVTVDYCLRGSKGSLNLGGDEKHFGRNGVLPPDHRT